MPPNIREDWILKDDEWDRFWKNVEQGVGVISPELLTRIQSRKMEQRERPKPKENCDGQ